MVDGKLTVTKEEWRGGGGGYTFAKEEGGGGRGAFPRQSYLSLLLDR